jgi:hypothetical protein
VHLVHDRPGGLHCGHQRSEAGYISTLDLDNDRTAFLGFPHLAKYAYTGAPWYPPHVSQISIDNNADTEPGGYYI